MISGEKLALIKKQEISMTTNNNDKNLETIKRIIQEQVGDNLSRIILFGSRARGDNNPDSDYDLMVVVKEEIEREKKQKFSCSIRKTTAKYLIPMDILIRSEEELRKFSNVVGTVIYNVAREGIML